MTFAFEGQRFYVANRGMTFSTNGKNRETNELRDGGKSIGRMAWGAERSTRRRATYPGIAQPARREGQLLRAGGGSVVASRGTAARLR